MIASSIASSPQLMHPAERGEKLEILREIRAKLHELLVPSLHGHIPQVIANVLWPAMIGFVDVVLSVAHDAQHPGDNAKWKCRFKPYQTHL